MFYEHPQYDHQRIENDVALIELPDPVEFGDTIRPVCLPKRNSKDQDLSGLSLITAGWGKTSNEQGISTNYIVTAYNPL